MKCHREKTYIPHKKLIKILQTTRREAKYKTTVFFNKNLKSGLRK